MKKCDRIVIGAGFYGLYAAIRCAHNGEHVIVLEREPAAFTRATYINQARVHMGYHYPRSLSTALKSAGYFERFIRDFGFCILSSFDQVYATSNRFSWTNAAEFERFCKAAGIRCDAVPSTRYFKEGMCDGAFLTTEYTYDAGILRQRMLDEIVESSYIDIVYSSVPLSIERITNEWYITTEQDCYSTPKILNASYASINNIHNMLNVKPFPIKYELCEIILCRTNDRLKNIGLTVMDGPFFSIMPFGKTGYHSLTSVTFTPHMTSRDEQPTFPCQNNTEVSCTPNSLCNCNDCMAKPKSAWVYMSQLARKYMLPDYEFSYSKSLFSMKPILKTSEVDDSRPTIIERVSDCPEMISVLSGKINTVYDLDPYLDGLE